MRRLAATALIILSIAVLALYLPLVFQKLFQEQVEKTHLFYSPVTQRFITKEKIVGPIPPEARAIAEDHHAEIAYRDEDGTWYTRREFQKRLPFIFYRNMDIWGLLPLRLQEQVFDRTTIKENRQVLELRPWEIQDRRPDIPLWPLLESNPGQARLVFPTDRFRMTDQAMQFINSDTNSVDADLTRRFTRALEDKGFVFPVRSVNGRFTILKPFDEGVFMVDQEYTVFQVKRRDGEPVVIRTPIDPALKTRHIKVYENKRREYYGLLLAGDGDLFLMTYDNYSLIPMPLKDYDPDRMDFKLILNPLYRTAIWSDETFIRAAVMDRDYQVLDRHVHRMSRAKVTPMERVHHLLFPFSIRLKVAHSGVLTWSFQPGNILSLFGILGCLIGYVFWRRIRDKGWPGAGRLALLAVSGLYGLLALCVVQPET
jgi:hypothetical protein